MLAASLVAMTAEQLYQEQIRIVGSVEECPLGVCIDFGYLNDLILAVGSLLGLLAVGALHSMGLLGTPAAALARYAVEQDLVWKWSASTAWQSLYVLILWGGCMAFRAITMPSDPTLQNLVQACVLALTSLLFMGLV